MAIYRLAAYFRIWDVDRWLSEITWDQLSEWLIYTGQEPVGEERDDLRIGALASVMWNCNIDTREGTVVPQSYVAGFNKERNGIFAFCSEKGREKERGEGGSQTGTLDLNDPIGWENFTTGLVKAVGRKKG